MFQQSRDEAAIVSIVAARLANSPYRSLSTLKCHCANGKLTLSGRVPTFYLRQMAWKTVEDIEGISELEDCIDVRTLDGQRD